MNPDGSIDTNILNYFETSSGKLVKVGVVDGTGTTAPVKISSHCAFFTFIAEKLIGGSENCLDVHVETDHVVVKVGELQANGRYVVSAKTSRFTEFYGKITGHGRDWDVNLGSASDQSMAIQEDTHLQLTSDSYPITVWSGNARRTTMDDPSKYKFVFKVPLCDVPYVGYLTCKIFIIGWTLLKKAGVKKLFGTTL